MGSLTRVLVLGYIALEEARYSEAIAIFFESLKVRESVILGSVAVNQNAPTYFLFLDSKNVTGG